MSGQKFFRAPFAVSGDKTAVPDLAQPDGSMSYTEGFGFDYQRDPTSDPDAKRIPRDQTNQYLYDITTNLRQYQLAGFPEWVDPSQNGGTPVAYPINAMVTWNGGSGTAWVLYVSRVVGATAQPGTDPSQWGVASTDIGALGLLKANNLSDVASPSTSRSNLGLGSAAVHPATDFLSSAAPSGTGGLTMTGGFTLTGPNVSNVTAVPVLNIILTSGDYFTKSISVNSAFTFGSPAGGGLAQGFILQLTTSAGAVPTWPGNVTWDNAIVPGFLNGTHVIGFLTFDGGTTWRGFVGGKSFG